jgi:eukaryotic-like serine/threonine-protein kinase
VSDTLGAMELPTTFGKYFLTEKLATGGMAEIYLGKLVGPGGFEKQLVIKQIHPRLTGQRHFVDLFVAEAKTLVTLAHGNIVPVYELGVIDDTYFIAMEYIDGPTLYRLTEALARQGARMDPPIAAFVASKILEGLDYAHRKGEGVIHRDLSPRNVMLSRDGEVKLVDFGIAVTLGEGERGAAAEGAPTGSFPYMSPEQVRREPLTGQTDLFSLGVLLWEMLVGHRLFARPDPDATLAAVTGGEIARPSSVRPEIPSKLDEVVMRALERDRAARWGSAAEMLAALQRYLYALDATPGPRDVAALVARHCPPETRRIPTHAEPATESVAGDDATPAGPRTAVVERPGQAPRGKQRARTETFATHVELQHMLERATPLFGHRALDQESATEPTTQREPEPESALESEPPARRSNTRLASIKDTGVTEAPEPAATTPAPLQLRNARPPSAAGIVLAALGTIGLGFGALYVFARGRAAVLQPDAAPKYDAPFYAFEPEERDALRARADAAPDQPDAPPPDDAAAPGDVAPPRDAGPRPGRVDAGAPSLDAAALPAGTATLQIGANPWGEIVVDGVAKGRTPMTLEVSASKHVVELTYPGEDPPRRKTFAITVKPGETVPVFHDFTR